MEKQALSTAADDQEFLTIKEVLARYRMDRRSLMDLVNKGEFPKALRMSRIRILFRRTDIQRWEETRWMGEGDIDARVEAATSSLRQPADRRPRPQGDSATSSEPQHASD